MNQINDEMKDEGIYDPCLESKSYEMPSTSLLTEWETENVYFSSDTLQSNKARIAEVLDADGVKYGDISVFDGPVYTTYEITPIAGTKIVQVQKLSKEIALCLSSKMVEIEPFYEKGTIGIMIPHKKPYAVSLKTMVESDAFRNSDDMQLPIALGLKMNNEPFVADIAKMHHILVAGASGTGKSACINSIICSLLYKKQPVDLKFVLIDYKVVELSLYNRIERHYLAKLPGCAEPVVHYVKDAVLTMEAICEEMNLRYDLLSKGSVRNIVEYNEKYRRHDLSLVDGHRHLPYIVVIIDEFADIIMTAGKRIEEPICRLAQLARAVGIYLIISTQRPTCNIITGMLKANFASRIAFRVANATESRNVLDTVGAERLRGSGDMLLSRDSDTIRLQGTFTGIDDINAVVSHIADQQCNVEEFQLPGCKGEESDECIGERDEYFEDAARIVFAAGYAAVPLLQRKLVIGFARAGRIIDQLVVAGIISPHNDIKHHDLLVRDEQALNEILNSHQ